MEKQSFIQRLIVNKVFRKSNSIFTFVGVTMVPALVFAAPSPESKYKQVIEGVSDLLIGLSIPAAILACIVYALQYKFAGTNGHKKADIIDSIKGTAGILIFVLTAGLLMNWIAGMVN